MISPQLMSFVAEEMKVEVDIKMQEEIRKYKQ